MARIEAKVNKNADDHGAVCIPEPLKLLVPVKFLLTLGLLSVSSLMAANKMSPDLENLPPAASVDVILQFTHPPSAVDLSTIDRAGGLVKQKFQSLHGVLA